MKKFNFLFPVMLLSASFSHAVTLHGTPGPDTVYANGGSIGSHTPGDDQIYGYAGDDTLYAGDGNDYVDGGAGDDTIGGGNGDDYLIGGPGNDTIWGGGGSDVIISSFDASGVAAVTNNVLIGGEGDDVIHCDERCNGFAIGGRGNDTFYISDNSNLSVNGGEGDDVYIIKSNKNMISTMSSGSQSLKIVDVSGRNKVVFEDSASYEVMFKKSGDKISITSGSGSVVLSVPVDAMTSYQFSDQTIDHGTVKMMAVE